MSKLIEEPMAREGFAAGVRIELEAVCHDCRLRHRVRSGPQSWLAQLDEWECKHRGHDIEFFSTKRQIPRGYDDRAYEHAGQAPWWLDYRENANIKLAYASSVAMTITLASLASDTNLLAGRSSAAEDNSTNSYLDALLCGQITNGTSPTASKEIDVWAWTVFNDTPTYPDAITGSDANITISTTNNLVQGFALVGSAINSATTAQKNIYKSVALSSLFGGLCPWKWGIWVVHNTGVALNATGTNHFWNYKPVYWITTG